MRTAASPTLAISVGLCWRVMGGFRAAAGSRRIVPQRPERAQPPSRLPPRARLCYVKAVSNPERSGGRVTAMNPKYDPKTIETRWQAEWEARGRFATPDPDGRKTFYCLSIFPYPSPRIHMGHVRNYTIG